MSEIYFLLQVLVCRFFIQNAHKQQKNARIFLIGFCKKLCKSIDFKGKKLYNTDVIIIWECVKENIDIDIIDIIYIY